MFRLFIIQSELSAPLSLSKGITYLTVCEPLILVSKPGFEDLVHSDQMDRLAPYSSDHPDKRLTGKPAVH
jgi:hypothetical protein